jgi:hypothetical protein
MVLVLIMLWAKVNSKSRQGESCYLYVSDVHIAYEPYYQIIEQVELVSIVMSNAWE